MTAGVHSNYIYERTKYGTYVYITNDGTGAIDIMISTIPRTRRGRVPGTRPPRRARYVHDIDVRDGLLYASYWNDGLVILDIGNGIKGGTPVEPGDGFPVQVRSRLAVQATWRMRRRRDSARGTHTAWRHNQYVFIADEVYRNGRSRREGRVGDRMYGTLQVLDVSDIEHPRSVAWYTPEMGGVHNVWAVADTLYLGAYDAGFHVFDISGELKGDLEAQQREIASLNTADMDGIVKNHGMTGAWS